MSAQAPTRPGTRPLIGSCGLATLVALAGCCLESVPEEKDGGARQDGGPAALADGGASDAGTFCGGLGRLEVLLQPQHVDFGNVVVNTTATQSLAMTNCSGIDVVVTIGSLKGTDPLLFASIPGSDTVLTLKDGETQSITVQYTPLIASPTQNQAYFAMKLCSSGTGCEPIVSLSGTAVSTGALVGPPALEFGCVSPGSTASLFVTISNVANAPIHLIAIPAVLNTDSTGGQSPVGAFQPGAGFPIKDSVIPPGQSIQIPVAFTPTATGQFMGELDISTDDATESNIQISLTGAGCTPVDAGS